MKKRLVAITVLTAAICAIILFVSLLHASLVTGRSMRPTLSDDHCNVSLEIKPYKIGQIVVCNLNLEGVVKRFCATGGDHVTFTNENFLRNESAEIYDFESADVNYSKFTNVDIVLSEDEVFLMGDNRMNSEDSRYFGAVRSDNIVSVMIAEIDNYNTWLVDQFNVAVKFTLIGIAVVIFIFTMNKITEPKRNKKRRMKTDKQ